MSNYMLRKAMGYTFQMGKDLHESAGGKQDIKKPEFADAAKDGAEWAVKVRDAVMSTGATIGNLLLHVVEEYGTREEAIAFVEAYSTKGKQLETTGNAVEQAAGRSALQYVNDMRRTVYAVFGKMVKGTNDKMVPYFGTMAPGMPTVKGKTDVLKLLKGPGDINAKIKSLPRFTNRGAPVKSAKGTEAIQKRYSDVEQLPPSGDSEVLARVLGVPSKVDGKELTDSMRQKLAQAQITAAIRAADDGKIEPILYAVAHRCRLSSEWAPMGTAILKAMEDVMNRAPLPVKSTTKNRRLLKTDKIKADTK